MGSIEAMEQGSKTDIFKIQKMISKKFVPEGIVGRVSLKGKLSEVIFN